MTKKTYIAPAVKVVEIESSEILAMSDVKEIDLLVGDLVNTNIHVTDEGNTIPDDVLGTQW